LLLLADANVYDLNGLLEDFFFAEADFQGFEGRDEDAGCVISYVSDEEEDGQPLFTGQAKLAVFAAEGAGGGALNPNGGPRERLARSTI